VTRILGTSAIVCLFAAILTPAVNIASRPFLTRSDIRPSDAILVLGAEIKTDGSLSYESQQRLLYGIRLYKNGLAPIFIVSGPGRPETAPESTVRAKIAVELGVPSESILEINTARTTREEAQQTARLLTARHLNQVLLVTDALHMLRSKLIFEAAGINVSPAPSDGFPQYASSAEDRLLLLRSLLMHCAGLVYYRVAGYI